MTAHSWIRKLFARPVTRPSRKTPIRRSSRLAIEPLEDRVVPVNQIDVIDLERRGPAVPGQHRLHRRPTGPTYSVGNEGDTVSVGFVPESGETFEPLLQFTVEKDDDGDLEGIGGDPQEQELVRGQRRRHDGRGRGRRLPGRPIPIWKQTDVGDDQVFDIPTLLGSGQSARRQTRHPVHRPQLGGLPVDRPGAAHDPRRTARRS